MTMTKEADRAIAVLDEAAYRLALAQQYESLCAAEESIALAAAGISRLSRTPMADDAAVAARIDHAQGWVTELGDDFSSAEVFRWDRNFEARCDCLALRWARFWSHRRKSASARRASPRPMGCAPWPRRRQSSAAPSRRSTATSPRVIFAT